MAYDPNFFKQLAGGTETRYYGARRAGLKGAKDYIQGGRMGVDPGAFQIGQEWTGQFDPMAQQMQQRAAPTMQAATVGAPGLGPQAEWENRQRALANVMAERVRGARPSAAELQMRRGMGRAVAEQQSMAAGATGPTRALAQRAAAGNIAGITADIAGQGAALRAQEQAQAEQALAGLAGAGRAQGLDVMGLQQQAALTGAGFQQQAGQANLQAAVQQQQMNDAMTQFYLQQGFGRDQAQQMAAAQMEQLAAQNYATAMGITPQVTQQGIAPQLVGAAAQLGAAGIMASDERVKEKKRNVKKAFDEFLKKVKGFGYNYIGDKDRSFGVMAQDLEKSKIGKSLVKEIGGVKMIDTVKGFGVTLGTLKRLAERVEALEGSNA